MPTQPTPRVNKESTPKDAPKQATKTTVADAVAVKPSGRKKRLLGRFCGIFTIANTFLEKYIPLWAKLGIVTIPALLGLTALSILLFVQGAIAVSSSQKTNLASHLINRISHMETQIQAERGLFLGYIDSDGAYFGDEILGQYDLTDSAIEDVMPLLRQLESEPVYLASVEALKFLVTLIKVRREEFYNNYQTVARANVVSFFSDINSRISLLKSDLISEASYAPAVLPKAVLLLRQRDDIMSLQDLYSLRRALVVVALTKGNWGINTTSNLNDEAYVAYMDFRDTITNEELLKKRYKTQYSIAAWERVDSRVFAGRELLHKIQDEVKDNLHSTFEEFSPQTWSTLCSEVINRFNALETELYHELQSDNTRFFAESLAQMIAGICMLVFFVIPTIIITFLVCRMVYRPVILQNKLYKLAVELADGVVELNFDLPSIVMLKTQSKKDLSQLEQALQAIIVNFESYLPYLPRHLLVRDEIIATGDDDALSVGTDHSSKNSSKNSSAKRSQSRSTTNTNTSKSSSAKRRRALNRIAKKSPTLMIVDLSDFVRASNEMNFDALQTTFTEYLDIISAMLEENNGLIQSFAGGIIICSWGAASKVFEPELKAARMASKLIESSYANPRLSFRMRISITSGACTVGEMGNASMRQFQVVGDSFTRCLALSKICKAYGVSMMVDTNVFKAISFEYDCKQLDNLNFDNTYMSAENIYTIVQSKNVVSSEWMYEMQSSEQKAIFVHHNSAWVYALKGDYEKARAKLEEFKEQMESKSNDRILMQALDTTLLEKIISRGMEEPGFRYKCSTRMWARENNLQ